MRLELDRERAAFADTRVCNCHDCTVPISYFSDYRQTESTSGFVAEVVYSVEALKDSFSFLWRNSDPRAINA